MEREARAPKGKRQAKQSGGRFVQSDTIVAAHSFGRTCATQITRINPLALCEWFSTCQLQEVETDAFVRGFLFQIKRLNEAREQEQSCQ